MSASTFVLSRSHEGRPERRQFEDEVTRALAANQCNVLVVPHVYYLTDAHPAVRRLSSHQNGIVLAAWLHPRAALWTVKAHGMPEDAPLVCFDLSAFASVDQCIARLAGKAGRNGTGAIEEIMGPVTERWYPVIDYSRCAGCGQCLDFCLFGVYSMEEGRVVAGRPDNCKPGCPACSRVCPEGAIIFPHYADDPAIAGAPGVSVSHTHLNVEELFDTAVQGKPCPVCGCACDCERSSDGTAPPGKTACPECGCICDCTNLCQCAGDCAEDRSGIRDDLDDLIDALDQLDD